MSESQQLLLGLQGNREAEFDSFFCGRDLKLTHATLKQLITHNDDDNIYLSGAAGTGKSHLLQAVCHEASQQEKTALYLPLSQLVNIPPEAMLESHQQSQFLCIDELDCIAGNHQWQQALFHLFNERHTLRLPIYFAAQAPAKLLQCELADLASRLTSCLSFQLPLMTDDEKVELLQFRAQRMGMQLTDSCGQFIISHYARDNHALIEALKQLDVSSLTQGRKITVPFIKSVLA